MIEDLAPMIFLFGGAGLVAGFLVARVLTYLVDIRALTWIVLIGGLAAAVVAGYLAFAFIAEPSVALMMLPALLAMSGAGLGAAIGGWRTFAAGGRRSSRTAAGAA
ncbi:MAG: hypothetical protein AAFQ45_13925 [Pseudomonadota bacterium]